MQNDQTTKILYVITKSNWGGAQRYVYDLATELSKRGDFSVAVALGGRGVLTERLSDANIRTLPLPSLERDIRIRGDVRTFFELVSLFRKERPDVIHLNSSKIGVLGAIAGRLACTARIIFTAHGWAHTEERPRYQKTLIKFFHALTVVLSDVTIAVSDTTLREMSGMPFTRKKLTVVHNGVTHPDLYERSDARHRLLGTTATEPFIIGTIAELHKNKGLPYAIEAFSRLAKRHTNLMFVIIGSGEEKDRLHALVREKNLSHRIIFRESSSANRYLRAYDVFILPSIKEGLPYTILEAGCAALPVVASRVGGIPEIITDGENGLLTEPRNSVSIEKALTAFITDSSLRRRSGEALRKTVHERFSTHGMVEATIAYYN